MPSMSSHTVGVVSPLVVRCAQAHLARAPSSSVSLGDREREGDAELSSEGGADDNS